MREKDKRARLMNEILGGIKVQTFYFMILLVYYMYSILNF